MTLRFAIVGSGPAGFFTVKALTKHLEDVHIDIFERLPVPYGLIRYGVAPDHAEIKNVINDFSVLGEHPKVRFFGNVTVVLPRQGNTLSHKFLKEHYSAVVYAYGAASDKELPIKGQSQSARAFVEWYNGMPGHQDFNLSDTRSVAVIGNGNVAVDVARILGSSVERLAHTDIADYALEALSQSAVTDIHMIGRRGIIQAALTAKELRLLTMVPGLSLAVDQNDLRLSLNQASEQEADLNAAVGTRAQTRARRRVFDLFKSLPSEHPASARVRLTFRFLLAPTEYAAKTLTLERTRLEGKPFQQKSVGTNEFETLQADLLFRSIGYQCVHIDPDLPFDHQEGIVKNIAGRVEDNVFVTGWAKTGPFGIIDTTMRSVLVNS